MRGKLPNFMTTATNRRITPAGAGKTTLSRSCIIRHWDHPRRCGENFFCPPAFVVVPGSPPQVRGKLIIKHNVINVIRITPAGAGKTRKITKVGYRRQDHPRRCGENPPGLGRKPPCAGSPPQVRGKPHNISCHLTQIWITPAGAGKTY